MDNKTPQSDGSREHLAHTPGPWQVAYWWGTINNGAHQALAVWPADIKEPFRGQPICLVSNCETQDEADDHNAHLIAAAPDLLEACEQMLASAHPSKIEHPKMTLAWAVAAQAIAKAKGVLSSDGSPNKKEEVPNGEQEAATVTTVQAGESALHALLRAAKCPNCDGSGAIQCQTQRREYVSREMAKDAGDPSMEGSLYQDDEYEVEQCQWCDERNTLLALSPNHEASGSGVEDTKRLDWLDKNAFQRVDEVTCRQSVHVGLLAQTFEEGRTLREAIDAAMKQSTKGEGQEQ